MVGLSSFDHHFIEVDGEEDGEVEVELEKANVAQREVEEDREEQKEVEQQRSSSQEDRTESPSEDEFESSGAGMPLFRGEVRIFSNEIESLVFGGRGEAFVSGLVLFDEAEKEVIRSYGGEMDHLVMVQRQRVKEFGQFPETHVLVEGIVLDSVQEGLSFITDNCSGSELSGFSLGESKEDSELAGDALSNLVEAELSDDLSS